MSQATAYAVPVELAHRIEITGTGCWRWTDSVTLDGYGHLRVAGRMRMAHRYAWELLVGKIPPRIELDHTCHTNDLTCAGGNSCQHRRCCNPAHLEPVTHQVNVLRSGGPAALAAVTTHCPKNHPYSGRNLVVFADGKRRCRACRLERDKRWKKESRRRAAT